MMRTCFTKVSKYGLVLYYKIYEKINQSPGFGSIVYFAVDLLNVFARIDFAECWVVLGRQGVLGGSRSTRQSIQ